MNTGYERDVSDDATTVNTDSTPRSVDASFGSVFVRPSYLIHTYTALTSTIFDINVTGVLDVTYGEDAKILVLKNTELINSIDITDASTFNFDSEVQVISGDDLNVFVQISSTVPFGDGIQHIKFDADPITTTYNTNDSIISISISSLIGDMKQIDFVKDVMQHFGAIYRRTRNSDNYEFKLMETLLFDKENAEDWSDKYVSVTNESYTSPYAQSNLLKYKYDTPETESEDDPTFADGEFVIDDLNLQPEKTMFTSNFKASESNGTHYVLKQWVDNSDDEIEANVDGLRMFKISVVNDSITYRYSPDISGTSIFSGDLPFLDFLSVDYDSEVELYYRGIYSMLNDYRKITVNCNLSVIDNYELDFFKLKYIKQLGQYYYLNKVISFKKDKKTKVELVEINEFVPEVKPEDLFVARLVTGTTVTASLTLTQPDSLVANLVTGATVTAILGLSNVSDEHNNFYNGTFLETFDALITEAAGVVTMTLTNAAGGDLTMRFSDGYTVLPTPVTIDLTVGTDSAQQKNWIYILKSTKVLTKSLSSWPSAEHIRVGFFFCQSAASVQTAGGTIINQNINDEGGLSDDLQGHMSGMAVKLRSLKATYFSGVDPNGTSSYLTITAGNVDFKSTAGINIQMHPQIFPAFDTSISSEMHIKNWSGDPFHLLTNLHDITADSTGTTIGNNKWFNLVFWGVQNKSGQHQTVLGNLPSGFYSRQVDAEHDVLGYNDFTIPREFDIDSSTGFLISLITVKMASTWVFGSVVDLRGTTPQTASGGASGISSSFVDSQFNIFNVADDTKDLMFDLSVIATGTTRTLIIQDADGTIALLSDVSTPDLQDVTDVGAEATNNIRSFTNANTYAELNKTGQLTCGGGIADLIQINATNGRITCFFGTANSMIIQFPAVASSNKTQTYQDATGTIMLVGDAPASHALLSHTISGETIGHVLAADSATTYSIRQLLGSEISNTENWAALQTSIVGITGTKAQFDTELSDGSFIFVGDAPSAHTHTLDVVLGAGASSDITLIIENGAQTAVASHGQTFFKVDDVTNSISATLFKDSLDFEKGGFIGSILAPSWTANRVLTLPDKTGTLAVVSDTSLQKVLDNSNTSTTNIVMNSGADIILWSGVGTGSKIAIDTSLFNMLDSAGTTFTQRTNLAYKAAIPTGSANMTLTATYLQFQKSSTYNIEPPATIGGARTATFIDATGEIPSLGYSAPASPTAAGVKGEMRITTDYLYICRATNVWERIATDGTW